MRVARHFDAQRVEGCVRAAEQGAQIWTAEGKIHRLLWPPDDPNALARGREHPDTAGPRAIDAADAVHLEAVWDAWGRAFIHVREDAASEQIAIHIKRQRVDVF